MSEARPGSPGRREWAVYARRVMATSPLEAVRVPWRALRAKRARSGWPRGYAPAPPADEGPATLIRLPLHVADGGAAPATIPLAAVNWPIAAGMPWLGRFDDPEDRLAAHRFSWAIALLAAHGRAALPLFRNLFGRWLTEFGRAAGGEGWDSYSVAERLVAAVYVLSADGRDGDPAIAGALRMHAGYLARHLEFRGASTNNHILNDARALYLAGAALGDQRLAHQARELFDFAVPRMFADGFLREGSTHYHLLLLRTLVEVAITARLAGDAAFAERAAARAREAAAAALFFADEGPALPLIGDLSPDFTPSFLAGLAPAVEQMLTQDGGDAEPSAWAALFAARSSRLPSFNDGADSRCAAGGYRMATGGFCVWAWVNPDGHVPAWSHAHADLGSFVASWHGAPLLVDAGRSTYAPGAMSAFGRSVRSHNAMAIDGAEPCVVHGLNGFPELLRSDYRDARPRARLSQSDGVRRLEIAHDGFARLGSGMSVSRVIAASKNALRVTDQVHGHGRHRVETFFHFAPEATVERVREGLWRVDVPGTPALMLQADADASACRGESGERPMGWTARRYGRVDPSTSLVFSRDAVLPLTATYSFMRA